MRSFDACCRRGCTREILGQRLGLVNRQAGPEVQDRYLRCPGVNGQGESREECSTNLREAIALILEHRREESLRSIPPDTGQDLVIVG